MIVLVDLALVVALFLSANIALGWAELASYPLHSDKSGLAGMGGIMLFMVMRWVALAGALAVAVSRGGWPGGNGPGTRGQVLATLAVHAGLGVLSYRALEWLTGAVQRDDPGPLRLAWVFGLVLPLPAFLVAVWGAHRRSLPRHPIVAGLVLAAIVAAHLGGWRSGARR